MVSRIEIQRRIASSNPLFTLSEETFTDRSPTGNAFFA